MLTLPERQTSTDEEKLELAELARKLGESFNFHKKDFAELLPLPYSFTFPKIINNFEPNTALLDSWKELGTIIPSLSTNLVDAISLQNSSFAKASQGLVSENIRSMLAVSKIEVPHIYEDTYCISITPNVKSESERKRETEDKEIRAWLLKKIRSSVKRKRTQLPVGIISIPRLFSVADNDGSIRDDRPTQEAAEWIFGQGKTQPYCVLRLAAENYARDRLNGHCNQIVVDAKVIRDHVGVNGFTGNRRYCTRPLSRNDMRRDKKLLNDICRNLRSKIPFKMDEVYVQTTGTTANLVFNIK